MYKYFCHRNIMCRLVSSLLFLNLCAAVISTETLQAAPLPILLHIYRIHGKGCKPAATSSTQQNEIDQELISAVVELDVNKVKALLSEGADPNTFDPVYLNAEDPQGLRYKGIPDHRRRVLLIAVTGQDFDLLIPGVPINLENRRLAIVTALVQHGADLNAIGRMGQTAMMRSIFYGWNRIARYLLAHGTACNIQDDTGNTALSYAASDNISMVRALVAKRADVNTHDKNGKTPLMCAMENQNIKIAQFLLDHGANPNVEDNAGNTPVKLAGDDRRMLDLLQKHGASFGQGDQRDR